MVLLQRFNGQEVQLNKDESEKELDWCGNCNTFQSPIKNINKNVNHNQMTNRGNWRFNKPGTCVLHYRCSSRCCYRLIAKEYSRNHIVNVPGGKLRNFRVLMNNLIYLPYKKHWYDGDWIYTAVEEVLPIEQDLAELDISCTISLWNKWYDRLGETLCNRKQHYSYS